MPINIRQAKREDASKIIKYINSVLQESGDCLEMSEGEFNMSIEEEMEFIEKSGDSENSIYVIAENEGEIIGALICRGSERIKIKHNTMLGMTVAENYRNKGIGSKMLDYAIRWAKESETIKRVELQVFKPNTRAIRLYEKFGFVIEGEKQNAVKLNNEFVNVYLMGLQV